MKSITHRKEKVTDRESDYDYDSGKDPDYDYDKDDSKKQRECSEQREYTDLS